MFSLSNIQKIALELDIELEVNSNNPGIHLSDENGDVTTISYDSILDTMTNEFNLNKQKNQVRYSVMFSNENSSSDSNYNSPMDKFYSQIEKIYSQISATANGDLETRFTEASSFYEDSLVQEYYRTNYSSTGSAA